jgi:hypothetical protein
VFSKGFWYAGRITKLNQKPIVFYDDMRYNKGGTGAAAEFKNMRKEL